MGRRMVGAAMGIAVAAMACGGAPEESADTGQGAASAADRCGGGAAGASRDEAKRLAAVGDDDGAPGPTLAETRIAGGAADWYVFRANDRSYNPLSPLDPTITMTAPSRTAALRVCAFVERDTLDCSSGFGTREGRLATMLGCCADPVDAHGGATLKVGLAIDGAGRDDSADIVVRVENTGTTCEPYTLAYSGAAP